MIRPQLNASVSRKAGKDLIVWGASSGARGQCASQPSSQRDGEVDARAHMRRRSASSGAIRQSIMRVQGRAHRKLEWRGSRPGLNEGPPSNEAVEAVERSKHCGGVAGERVGGASAVRLEG
jgi:hypothetical protein